METELLFRDDAYLRECEATVTASEGNAIVLDRTVFYPMGGGQPGDTGRISWDSGSADVVDTRYGDDGAIQHLLADGSATPEAGTVLRAELSFLLPPAPGCLDSKSSEYSPMD